MRRIGIISWLLLLFMSISIYSGCDGHSVARPNAGNVDEAILLNIKPYSMPARHTEGKTITADNLNNLKKLLDLCTEEKLDRKKTNFRFGEALFFKIKDKNSNQSQYVGVTSNSWFYWNPEARGVMVPFLYSDEDSAKNLHWTMFRDLYDEKAE